MSNATRAPGAAFSLPPDVMADLTRALAEGHLVFLDGAPAVSPGFAAHFEAVAPSWFRPDVDQLERLHDLWSQFVTAKALVERLRPDVERLAEVIRSAWDGWGALTSEMADPNEMAGPVCDLVADLTAAIIDLEGVDEYQLVELLNRASDPPKPKRCRRKPLVTLTDNTVSMPAGLSSEGFDVHLSVAS